MPATIDVTQKLVGVSVEWLDRRGNVAPVDGATTLTVDSDAISIIDNGNGTFDLVSADSVAGPVAVTVKATADADLGEGVVPVEATDVVTVAPAGAVSGAINFGTPADK